MTSRHRTSPVLALLMAATSMFAAVAMPAHAQFAAAVTPPRIEVHINPGEITRQVIEITQAIRGVGNYRVYTADWSMDAAGALSFYDKIQPGSCRPWVAIERREVAVSMGARVRFRFEVSPPADTTPKECRFALMIESKTQEVQSGSSAAFPLSGRIAVIVYVAIGDVKPVLEPGATSVVKRDGQLAPAISIHNRGAATGRLTGILQGVDASGAAIEFAPESVPVLPEQTRIIVLQPYEPGMKPNAAGLTAAPSRLTVKWPLALTGNLEFGAPGVGRIPLDRKVEAAATLPTQ